MRLAFVTGEGFGEEARTDLIERLKSLGARRLGSACPMARPRCRAAWSNAAHGSGYHNPAPDQFLFETVDPSPTSRRPTATRDSSSSPISTGAAPSCCATRLGDVARLTRQRCPHCGALTERIVSQPRRVDDLVKIKGMLVNPQALVDAVLGEAALLDFQAVVDKENPNDPLSMDRLRLRIVPAAGADAALDARLARAFSARSASPRQWSGPRRTIRCSPDAAGRPSRCSISGK